jgi:hypothetical protein
MSIESAVPSIVIVERLSRFGVVEAAGTGEAVASIGKGNLPTTKLAFADGAVPTVP